MVFRRANGAFPLTQLRSEMDRLVSDFFGPQSAPVRWAGEHRSFPALNVWEEGDVLFAEAELPGVRGEDVDISVVGSDLTIRGRRGGEPREGVAYHRQERGTGEFTRVVRLPIEVDAEKVEASLADGILLVKLPRAESAKPKKIQVVPGK